jgi:hypothetical protein
VTLAVPEDESIWPRVDVGRFVKDFQDSDYLVLVGGGSPSISDLARRQFDLLSDYGGTSLWIHNELRSPTECDGAKWPFREFYQSSQDTVVCPRYPIAPGITGEGSSGALFFSGDKFAPVIGSGTNGRLRFDLLVKKAAEVDLSIRVDPRNFERLQTLQLWLAHADSEPEMFSATFDRKEVLHFSIRLQPNIYTVQIGLADGSLQVGVPSIQVTAR